MNRAKKGFFEGVDREREEARRKYDEEQRKKWASTK